MSAHDDETFAAEVRDFVRNELPAAVREKVRSGADLTRADYVDWLGRLYARGWGAPIWPVEYGGCGWSARQRWLFERELALGWAPRNVNSGMFMLGPVLIAFGTDEQRATYLPPILRGEDWWCQGFSEPNSGSDLASLRTAAPRDGDDYVVDGEKIWVSFAQHATRMFLLARTDTNVKPQAGISFLLTPIDAPGITVRPIATVDGRAEINAVSLESVRIPVANRVGDEGQGWTYAKFLLTSERDVSAELGSSLQLVERARNIARERASPRYGSLLDDPSFAGPLAEAEIRLHMLWRAHLAAEEALERGAPAAPSYLKLAGTEVQQTLLRLLLDASSDGMPPDDVASYLNGRKLSIYAGVNEVHRDLMARHLLGA
jgi:alkylation response protein AidB-like acyl-CoA dehydrogenase